MPLGCNSWRWQDSTGFGELQLKRAGETDPFEHTVDNAGSICS